VVWIHIANIANQEKNCTQPSRRIGLGMA